MKNHNKKKQNWFHTFQLLIYLSQTICFDHQIIRLPFLLEKGKRKIEKPLKNSIKSFSTIADTYGTPF